MPNVLSCSNCGAPKLSHHICGSCGYYGGKPMTEGKVKEVIDAE
jgi:large subunit ribosomal protein L32